MGQETRTELLGEQLIVRRCGITGLHAAIAIDSTTLGPAAGGCRRWLYVDEQAGIEDAQRLAAGMSLKNALAGIPFGGGKSVIFAVDKKPPTEAQLLTFADWLNELGGHYITAEDVGMGVAQIRTMATRTDYVSGSGLQGVGGDPSPQTAFGVYTGLKAAVQMHMQRDLYGLRVAVQGLGAVGLSLCHWLARAGVELIVADLDANRVRQVVKKYDARPVSVEAITQVEAEVFAPCAMGGVLDEHFVDAAKFRVIAGAANNQLDNDAIAEQLQAKNILYAPDFVLNAGGVVSVAHEYLLRQQQFGPEHDATRWVGERIDGIPERLTHILERAKASGETPHHVAQTLARSLINPALAVAA